MGKVLVVDDEEPIGIYLSRLIGSVKKTELGQVSAHEVKVVFTASDAFAALDAGTFGMVIADLRLPDAPDTALWVSQLCQKAGKARVVLISGMIPSPELDLCAKENGVMTFLSKPFELGFVKKILKEVFG